MYSRGLWLHQILFLLPEHRLTRNPGATAPARLHVEKNAIIFERESHVNLISTQEAANQKRTSPQIIRLAISRGDIDALQVGGLSLVKDNRKFDQWQLSERHVEAARMRWGKAKRRKR